MATSKQAGQNKQGNIFVQDNKNARKRFGFGGVGPITSAPKTGDMFYIEFHDMSKTTAIIFRIFHLADLQKQ